MKQNINAVRCIAYNFITNTMLFKCCRYQSAVSSHNNQSIGIIDSTLDDTENNNVIVTRLDLDDFDKPHPCLRCCCYGNAIAPLQQGLSHQNNPSIILTSPRLVCICFICLQFLKF